MPEYVVLCLLIRSPLLPEIVIYSLIQYNGWIHFQRRQLSHWFLKDQIFSLFTIVKMNANYAEICRVGNLEADFQ